MQMQDKIPLASFIDRGKKFYIEKCLAKCIQDNIHLATPHNFQRYLPTCDLIDNSLYIFGGSLQNKTGIQTMLYEYNIRTNEWRGIKSHHDTNFRYGQASTSYKNTIFYFGGINSEGVTNDFFTYQPYQNKWTSLQNKGQPPCPRQKCFLIHTAQKYLICFGGLNTSKKQAYFDGFIWSQEQGWSTLEIANPPEKRVNFCLRKIGNKLILFGGEGAQQNQQYFNDLYIIDIEFNEKKLIFNKLQINSLDQPIPRIGYAMITLSQNYFIIAGGETKINQQMQCLRDLWVFDMNERQWLQIQPKNGVFFYLRYSSYAMYKNTIFFYSGFDKKNSIVNRLYTLSFHEKQKTNSQLCSLCAERNLEILPKAINYPQQMLISIGYIYNLAIQIKCCFQAFSLLADSAILQKANYMNISMMKGTSDFLYIDITFDGNILNKTQFNNFLLHGQEQQKFAQKIKLGSFRLGKTFVFISAGDDVRRVCMFSANSKICPNFDETYSYFSYAQNVGNGHFLSSDGVENKNMMINSLNLFLESPSDLLDAKEIKNRILIFQNHALMTSSKICYYQLISENPQNIEIYKNHKKVEFLQKIGQKINTNPELSLKDYLSIYNKSLSKLTFTINHTSAISVANIPRIFQQLQQKNLITKLAIPQDIKLGETAINLYIACTNEYLSECDLGILIYLEERLINRYTCKFGELFQEKFYKKKYRKPEILFKIFGFIDFDRKEVQMDILGIKVKPSIKYKQFEKKLNKFLARIQQDLTQKEIEKEIRAQEQQEEKIEEKQV